MLVQLYEASIVGDWETGKIILNKRPDLLRIDLHNNFGTTLHMATTADETKFTLNFIKNLVHMMKMEDPEIKNGVSNTAFWMAYVALQILEDHPELADNVHILAILAGKPDAFNRLEKNLITRIIQSSVAAKMGNTRFLVGLFRNYHSLMFVTNDGLTIFHIAVMHRHQDIYNLLYEIGIIRNNVFIITNESDNNMLHLVGKTSKERAAKTSGASLLMQRELLWFKLTLEQALDVQLEQTVLLFLYVPDLGTRMRSACVLHG
ncbi:hypothetical protein E3N88_38350 [Mikania micrantha]|uniref:PGG domain-containing protein n=1 Tax=Mikania micrantha TaxID=192012 RepID=A0A5N6LTU0_9ASTR|nr:hypothetical protein E3N88_38350 [Mikania micrantha]